MNTHYTTCYMRVKILKTRDYSVTIALPPAVITKLDLCPGDILDISINKKYQVKIVTVELDLKELIRANDLRPITNLAAKELIRKQKKKYIPTRANKLREEAKKISEDEFK